MQALDPSSLGVFIPHDGEDTADADSAATAATAATGAWKKPQRNMDTYMSTSYYIHDVKHIGWHHSGIRSCLAAQQQETSLPAWQRIHCRESHPLGLLSAGIPPVTTNPGGRIVRVGCASRVVASGGWTTRARGRHWGILLRSLHVGRAGMGGDCGWRRSRRVMMVVIVPDGHSGLLLAHTISSSSFLLQQPSVGSLTCDPLGLGPMAHPWQYTAATASTTTSTASTPTHPQA